MRYVTITKSKWFNNGLGIVPNALDSEKYAPPEDNVITDNDIFWNNFNYYAGAPFKLRADGDGRRPVPGRHRACCSSAAAARASRTTASTATTCSASAALQQFLLKQKDAADTDRQQVVSDNQFGAERHGPERPRPVLRRQRHGQLLRRQHAASSPPCPPTARRSSPARSRARTRSTPGAGHGARAGRWTRRSRTGSSTRTPPSSGYTPLERYVKGQTPMEQPSK